MAYTAYTAYTACTILPILFQLPNGGFGGGKGGGGKGGWGGVGTKIFPLHWTTQIFIRLPNELKRNLGSAPTLRVELQDALEL